MLPRSRWDGTYNTGHKNPNDQILSLRKQIKTQDKRQETRIAEVKRIVKDALKDQIVDNMKWVSVVSSPVQDLTLLTDRAQIQDQIQEEIALQVREQVVSQIRSHLPILLDEVSSQVNLTPYPNSLSASRTIPAPIDSSAKCAAKLVSAAGLNFAGMMAD
jgi:hypothetical protein